MKHGERWIVQKLDFVLLLKLAQPLKDDGPLVRRQLGQFSNDFRGTHDVNLTPMKDTGKPGYGAPGANPMPENKTSRADFQCQNPLFVKWET